MVRLDTTTLAREEIEKIRELALRAVSPIKPASKAQLMEANWWRAERTKAGRDLPHYYLVYFLLIELLRFPHVGQGEKIAWSIPIEFEGTVYFIEYRKFGLGVFCQIEDLKEAQAKRIVSLISKGVKVADPFFRSLANGAVQRSHINVKNNSARLFWRYEYLRDKFRELLAAAIAHKGEVETETKPGGSKSYSFPARRLIQEARWIGIAAVDAFFAWTEHIFIHMAIIQSRVKTGEEVSDLIDADWASKFKQALDIAEKDSKLFYDSLGTLRRQIRNYMAHGSFGKQGEAFKFHSGTGAVPVMLNDAEGASRFSLTGEPEFDEEAAISTIEEFIAHLWSGDRYAAWLYIQDASLPMILTYASDGTYENAMKSSEDMEGFIDGLIRAFDDAGNMDW